MKDKTFKEDDKESQIYKCLVCDEESVKWDGEKWECLDCHYVYGGLFLEGLLKGG